MPLVERKKNWLMTERMKFNDFVAVINVVNRNIYRKC